MGKGGGKQHTPYEAPNDLTSRQKLSIIDLVSEGPIEGPVGDLKGVYLNNTPVIDSSGNSNVNGMTAQWVAGTLEQPALEGFSSSSSETPVSIEIKKSTPVTRTITSRNIDRLRLTFGTQALVEVKDNGDRVGTSVELQIQVQRNGAWVTEKNITIRGKRSNSPYLMAVIIDKLPPPFSIRMVRLTPDSNSDKLQNNTIWSSYTEITDINQTYPGSAVAGLTFESEQFGNQYPTRNYLVRGLIVQVPNNYNPETRVYSGIWDGTFKPAYTNNPAWVLYSLLTTKRFGLGKRLKIAEVDKFALYVIGQYCDQLVPDGFGNKEPRVTCNAYITDIRKAYDYFSDLCSIMRIMPVWNGLQMTFVQDRPSDVVWPYTNANVVNGRFHYSFSPLKARHTVIEVRFIDPQNGWKTSVEQVSDDALVAQFGLNVLRVDAFGCTSRGQARRYGLWILLTEKLETQTVEFEVGAEGLRHTPGDIIEIMDNDWVDGEDPIGGRLIGIDATQKVLTLDREVIKPKSGTAFISLMNATGRYERVKVTGYLGNNQIKVESVPKGVATKSVWGINQPDLARRLFRAITISDKGDGTYGVIAVQHIPEKEAMVDQGIKFEPLPDTPLGGYIPPVENLSVEVSADSDNWQVEANWTTATAVRGVDFVLKLTQAGRIVGTAKTQENRYRIGNLPQGNYLLSVAPQNKDGQKGEQASVSFDINPPPPPSYIDVEPGFFSLGIIPHVGGQNALRLQYEFWFSEKQIANINEVELLAEYLGNGTMWVIQGRKLKAGQTYYVYVRTVNPVGKSQFVEASGKPEDRADEILEVIGDKFLSNEAGQKLQEQINFNKDHIEDLTLEQLEIKHDIINVDSKTIDLNNKVVQINTDVAIVNEAVMQNAISLNNVTFRLMEEEGTRKAEILDVREIIIDDQKAFTRYQSQVSSQFEYVGADVYNLQQSLATTNEAFAQQMSQVRADLNATNDGMGKIAARVTTNEEATANIEKSQAKFEQVTLAEFEYQRAYINQISSAFSDQQMSMSEAIMQTTAQFNSLNDKQLKSEAKITKNEKAIATETEARATMGVQLEARIDSNESGITEIKETVAEQGKTIASTTEQLRAEIKTGDDKLQEGIDNQGRELSKISSSVDEQKTAIAELDKTQTELKQTQQSNYEENNAHIANLQQTIANSDSANAEAIMQTTAQTTLNHNENLKVKASVERQQKAIANQQEAHAELSEKVDAQYADNQATFVDIRKSQADDKKAASEHTEQVRAELGKDINANKEELSNINAVVTQHTESIATLDETTTQIKQTQQSQHEETQASIGKLTETTANTDKALTEAKEQSKARFEDNEASINHIEQTMANTEGSQVEAIGQLTAQQNVQGTELLRAKASITRIDKVVADNNHAFAQSIEKLETQFDDVNARITTLKKTVSDNEKAQAEVNELIKSEIGDNKAAIELRGQTVFDHKGNGSAIYTIKTGINWNGQYYDAKFMMGATVKNGKVVTQIGFSADTFGIFNPSSGKLEPVFFVENGQVFINEAFINKATIEKIIVGTDMRSKNYVPGKSGMRIDMENGIFETNSNEGDYSVIRNSKGDYFKYKNTYIIELGWFL
ncbi:TipJ family phage tail tip protein [Providencia sp. PROV153]|uniref:TipJ family phage tail tip protein n=1 Tax=Providencia sp. PROV153 TaxID=2949863 RepID=UPI00234BAFF9|nr:phage tail protein [Providencia sp. PROV153]